MRTEQLLFKYGHPSVRGGHDQCFTRRWHLQDDQTLGHLRDSPFFALLIKLGGVIPQCRNMLAWIFIFGLILLLLKCDIPIGVKVWFYLDLIWFCLIVGEWRLWNSEEEDEERINKVIIWGQRQRTGYWIFPVAGLYQQWFLGSRTSSSLVRDRQSHG